MRLIDFLIRRSPLAILTLAWEAAPRLGLINPQSLPPLSVVAVSLWQLAASGEPAGARVL